MSNASCPNVSRCPLYEEFNLSASLRTWQIRYCHADFSRCERYRRHACGEEMPSRLLPSGEMLPEKKRRT
ncbi:MAG: hypothetical protein GXP55_07030 [Deltaproteobacteria bacterium]|nr:hypothetical protein [Deltaproteobacteria bacterium]